MDTGTESVVYFIKNESNGHVKIGTTTDFRTRFFALQNECNGVLEPLGVIPGGDARLERKLQRRFAEYHVEGEWFRINPHLVRYVSEFTQAVERPEPISEGWGGRRKGTGRPKDSGEYPRQLTVRVTEEQYQYAHGQDDGAASFVRRLIDKAMSRQS